MDKKRMYIRVVLITILTIIAPLPKNIYANNLVHKTIRVGLRSAYSNVSSVDIKNERLHIGYEQNDRFNSVGILNSNSGYKILPSYGTYYETGESFYSYQDAKSNLDKYRTDDKAVVGLVYPNTWTIYLANNKSTSSQALSLNQGIEVRDGLGNTMLVANYTTGLPAFAGESNKPPYSLTTLSKGEYRGWFEFIRKSDKITAVNILDYEEYLYGVIPAEMPPSWDMEALKAQAVASRSMALYQYNKYIKDGYNVCDTVYTQVYKGFSGEVAKTNQAVDETRGIIATYNNKVAETLFYSTSGGHTEDPFYVWGNTVDYLKATPDPFEIEPEMKPWTRTITLSEIDLCLSKAGANIGSAKGVRINSYTPAGRVNELEIIGTTGTYKLTKENIRTFFSSSKEGSLRSRMFTIDNGEQNTSPSIPSSNSDIWINGNNKVNISNINIISANTELNNPSSITVKGSNTSVVYGNNKVDNNTTSNQVSKYGDITISGSGYGHGVGMSQSGARGMAKLGYNYEDIIKYYYKGVTLNK